MAGGYDGHHILNNVEILPENGVWSVATPLPKIRRGVRGITVDNVLYMIGGQDQHNGSDDILFWSPQTQEWKMKTKMRRPRDQHALTTIMTDNVAMEFCV